MDRGRLLDMERRIGPVRRKAIGLIAVTLLVCGPWMGFWTLLPLLLAGVVFQVAEKRAPRSQRPEYVLFAAWTCSELAIAGAVALSGGPEVPTLSWLAIPVVTLSARFSARGVTFGVLVAMVLLAAVALGTDASAVMDNPVLVLAPAALIAATAILSTALMQSDLHFRNENVIDPLTGMLNRKALGIRVAELAQQSEVSGEPIGIVVGDLDHFKEVNDNCGHTKGDAVLKDVASDIRKELRAFDLGLPAGWRGVPGDRPRIRRGAGGGAGGAPPGGAGLRDLWRRPARDHELRRERLGTRGSLRVLHRLRRGGRGAVRGQAPRPRPGVQRGRPARAVAGLAPIAEHEGTRSGASKQRRMAQAPERHTPFASLEASSRERLLAETAESWYHFGDSANVADLIERVEDALREGDQRLAGALIFGVLSSDDTNLARSLGRDARPA